MSYITKTLAEIKTNMIFNIITNVDSINDANIGSILDIFVTSISQEIEEQYTDLDDIYQGTHISTATGTDLEELGLLVGITRNVGTKAAGSVSFIRNNPATNNFTIAANSIVSTQPITGETQYNFIVTTATQFLTEITGESHTYIDGIYDYPLNQRFLDSVDALSGIAGSSAYVFIEATDFDIIDFDGELEDLTDYSLLDNCETVGDWPNGEFADAVTLNSSTFLEGAGGLNLRKTSTAGNTMTYSFTDGTTTDFSEADCVLMLYIKDSNTLAKIQNVQLGITDDSIYADLFTKQYNNSDLSVGWNLLYLDHTDSTVITTGNPDIVNTKYYAIRITTVANSSTFAAGDLIIDHLHKSKVIDYDGNIIRFDNSGTLPDASTSFFVDYIPLSLEVPVEAQNVGSGYNVGTGQITYKVTNIPQIDRIYNYSTFSGGINVETDAELKTRIENASAAANVATVDALEYNLLTLSFISSVNIVERPEKTATEEVFVYDNSIDNYALRQKVAIDDANMTIGDTTGASDYTRVVDFLFVEEDNEIEWTGISTPTHGNLFYVNYHYNKLGYVEAFIVGRGGQLTSSQVQEAQDLLDEKKAAGIIVTVLQPTYIDIDITATLTIISGYTSSTVISDVEDSITTYFNTLSVGDDVLLAEIIWAIMNVEGVQNCSVSDIGGGGAADYTIASTEVAKVGTLSIS